MRVLIILTKTPAEQGFNTFLKFSSVYMDKDELSIYLIGNGVFSARKGHLKEDEIKRLIPNCSIYAYSDDMKARGISRKDLIAGIKIFESYDDLVVDMMENKDQVLSL